MAPEAAHYGGYQRRVRKSRPFHALGCVAGTEHPPLADQPANRKHPVDGAHCLLNIDRAEERVVKFCSSACVPYIA